MLALGYLVPDGLSLYLFLPAYVLIGYDVLYHAGRNLFTGQLFDENFLMCLATIGALATGDYPEAVFVMLFYQVGSLFESYAVGRSRASIAELMNIRPDMARVVRNGQPQEVAPEQVQVGETILVAPGERVPLDGVVSQGESALDTSALTGESLPRNLGPGDEALSGCINQSGLLEIQVTKPFGQSTVNKILEMVEHAASKKARTETFITRFARYYTPCVVVCALLLCLLPPLFTGQPFAIWLRRALIFLVVSCPCALVISVPLGFFGGIGGASRQGILIKGSNYLEALAHAQIVAMDKTGTLTQGRFSVQACYPVAGVDQATLLETAALAECYSVPAGGLGAAPPRPTGGAGTGAFGPRGAGHGARGLGGRRQRKLSFFPWVSPGHPWRACGHPGACCPRRRLSWLYPYRRPAETRRDPSPF